MTRKRSSPEPSPWARALWTRSDWVVLDTETTGLDDRREVIEVAILGADGGPLLDTLVRPGRRPTAAARRVHRLDLPELSAAPDFPAIHRTLFDCLDRRMVIAFGAAFDRRTIEVACRRHRLPMPATAWQCLLSHYQEWRGFSASLRIACELEGLSVEREEHRALYDARLAWRLLKVMAGHSV